MHTFQTYDLFRLSHFQKRKPKIDFGDTHFCSFYRFNEVDYFNYILFKTNSYDQDELDQILRAYVKDGRSQIKFLFPKNLDASFDEMVQKETLHEIACLRYNTLEEKTEKDCSNSLSLVSNWEDLLDYTRIYLEGFGSTNTNHEEIAQNFQLLMQDQAVDFYFVNQGGQRVGICSNFYGKEAVFLSAGAILAPYQNSGLHKQIIAERVALAKLKGHTEFVSWAYSGSVSYHNLIKSNFLHYATYCEYISKPLEALTGAVSLLQS